jgi:hypothetical protein
MLPCNCNASDDAICRENTNALSVVVANTHKIVLILLGQENELFPLINSNSQTWQRKLSAHISGCLVGYKKAVRN